jgi:hypothetical protein
MRTAENIPESNHIFSQLLQEAGFEVVLDQNMMVLDLSAKEILYPVFPLI